MRRRLWISLKKKARKESMGLWNRTKWDKIDALLRETQTELQTRLALTTEIIRGGQEALDFCAGQMGVPCEVVLKKIA